jgi:hypothetical protein
MVDMRGLPYGRRRQMSDQELAQFIEDAARLDREIVSNPEKARRFLIEEGFLDESGALTENYR